MRLLIFDTETTGLPTSRLPAEKAANNWPHIVSISWIVLETDTNTELYSRSYIVKPDGWTIPEESVKIHGITTEIAKKRGYPLFDVMNEFLQTECEGMVAHNLDFDMGVIVNAVLWDLKLRFPVITQRRMCTMLLGRDLCRLPGRFPGKYKPPKLSELYLYAFGVPPDTLQLHNSMYDVSILSQIIRSCLPLRQAMGLVASGCKQIDGNTLTIHCNDDLGE